MDSLRADNEAFKQRKRVRQIRHESRENILGGENFALLPPWGPADLLLDYMYLSQVSLPEQTFYSRRQGENSCAVDVCLVLGHNSPLRIFFFFTTNY